jgi:hypothetical protein
MEDKPSEKTVQRALRLLSSQVKASRTYYERNKEAIKAKSVAYWETHRELINEKRRDRYAAAHPKKEECRIDNGCS